MTISSEFKPKRIYSAPELVVYGDMGRLTKAGTGSILEMNVNSVNMSRRR